MYYGHWFKEEKDAKEYVKEHGGRLSSTTKNKRDHYDNAEMFGFNPEEFKFSVLSKI